MPNAPVERYQAQLTGTRRSPIERLRRAAGPYVLIAPAAGFIGLIFIYSLIRLAYASLHTGDNGNSGPAQLDAYRFVLNDEIFRTAVKHNLLLLISVPVVLVLALAIALILHEGIMGWRVYRTVVFVPYILAIPVLGTTFIYLLSLDGGINTLLGDVGLGFLRQDWLGSPSWVLPSIAAIIIYHELGFGVVLFLARLLSLPEEVDQAARIDGCSWWQLRRRITLPQMTGVITAFVTLELINMLSWVFAYVYSTTKGGPNFASYVLELYIFDSAFTFRAPSFAAAAAILLLAASTVLITVQVRRTSIEVNPE
ncbi:MAG TPA: sugar ABC transporter permease [Gaiellales bacterium]|nr:sugar ABC transporter permease [Gaiellales bacterium]